MMIARDNGAEVKMVDMKSSWNPVVFGRKVHRIN